MLTHYAATAIITVRASQTLNSTLIPNTTSFALPGDASSLLDIDGLGLGGTVNDTIVEIVHPYGSLY